jgi:hypothetical protein
VAHLFGVGESTVKKKLMLVCRMIVNTLGAEYISAPGAQRMSAIMADFQRRSGISQIAGAIDGCHIKLKERPRVPYPKDYYSRKDDYAIILQGVCDVTGKFWSIDCQHPACNHDAFVYRQSAVYHFMLSDPYPLLAKEVLGRVLVRPMLVGDDAYPLSKCLLKPFHEHNAHPDKRYFDAKVSSARVSIENAFARLKNRWAILKNLDVDIKNAAIVVQACCILHNFVETHEQFDPIRLNQIHEDILRLPDMVPYAYEPSDYTNRLQGKAIRNILMEELLQ